MSPVVRRTRRTRRVVLAVVAAAGVALAGAAVSFGAAGIAPVAPVVGGSTLTAAVDLAGLAITNVAVPATAASGATTTIAVTVRNDVAAGATAVSATVVVGSATNTNPGHGNKAGNVTIAANATRTINVPVVLCGTTPVTLRVRANGTAAGAAQRSPDRLVTVAPAAGAANQPNCRPQALLWSPNANRSNPVALNGGTVGGLAAVLMQPDVYVASVAFSLDGVARSTDTASPFDFNGTAANGTATRWNSRTQADGPHTITALVTNVDGTTATLSATFSVTNTPVLEYSLMPSRTNPTPLAGAALTKPIYVFVSPTPGITQVVFTINTNTGRTERTTPYDLGGTAANGTANPVTTGRSGLRVGSNTVTAAITFDDGTTRTLTSTFTVA